MRRRRNRRDEWNCGRKGEETSKEEETELILITISCRPYSETAGQASVQRAVIQWSRT